MSSAYYKLFKDSKGEYRWSLYAPNHKIIATSGEGYTTKRAAQEGIQLNRSYGPVAGVQDETQSQAAGWR